MKMIVLLFVMKIKKDTSDIKAIFVDMIVDGKRIVLAHEFMDWQKEEEEIRQLGPGYVD